MARRHPQFVLSKGLAGLLTVLTVAAGLAQPADPADGYDASWYRTDFWSGEYPNGFSLTADTTLAIRSAPDPDAPRSIACGLGKKATYHPWNTQRVEADHLAFIAFSKIEDMTVDEKVTSTLVRQGDDKEVVVTFAPGDVWRYLTYGAEGFFLMEYQGVVYMADQDLIEKSTGSQGEDDDVYHEWLQLDCANGASGWLFMRDLDGEPAIASPNILGYGEARDLD